MTAIPQKTAGLSPSGQSTTAPNAAVASHPHSHTPSPSVSGSSSPLAPASASSTLPRSYASATKQSAAPVDASSVPRPGPTQQQQHGKLASVSPVSDSTNNSMQTNQPSGVTIVNGAHTQQQQPPPVSSASSAHGDHSRKPSVTITSAGTSGYMPNGGGPAGRATNLQFGFTNPQSSPSMGHPAVLAGQSQPGLGVAAATNPRVTSPQTSPSPIPQPASSGGRPPPSSYQAQGNGPNFGSFGDAGDASMRPNMHGPLGPGSQTSHLRRESTQSTHSDMSSHMGSGPAGPGRGGYPHQGGRGRGYSQSSYQGQMPYSSPGPNFRSTPNQPRGGHNMGAQFHGHTQGRPLPFPNSPHQANRSPALANAHPTTPQMNPVPMAHAQMPPQHYGAYGQHMGPQPGYAAHAYDPNYGYYNPAYGMQQMQFMTPPSPQPRPGLPYNAPSPYMQNQYPVQPPPQAQPLSRTPSQLSSTDRPGSSLGQIPSTGGPGSSHAHTSSRASNSPAPSKTHFVIPPTKRAAIVIKDPSGAVKTFDKTTAPASPARATPSPVKVSTPTATPPPRTTTASSADSSRIETARVKTDEEKKRELRDAVLQKIERDEAERRQKEQEEEAARKKKDEDEAAATKSEEGVKATDAPAVEEKAPESVEKAMENLSLKEEPSKAAEAAPAVEEPAKAAAPTPAPAAATAPAADDEIDYDAIEREMAEIEAKEAAAEAEYQRKKQAQKEEQARKEREEREAWEANMKKAEREAEALEEARMKKLEAGDEDTARKEREELFASLKKGGDVTTPATESPAAHTPADSGAATPVSTSDVSMGPPAKPAGGTKKPAPLKLETTKAVEPPQPSAAMKALQSARFVDDLSKITYPPSVVSPNPALNASAPADRKFHYNKEFLLQFQAVFKEKPSIDWDARVRETVGGDSDSARPQSARTPSMAGGRTSSRPGIPQSFQVMGTFGQMGAGGRTLPPGTTSEARFNMSNAGARTPSMGAGLGSFGRPGAMVGAPGMVRTGSAGGMHPGMPQTQRVGSGRGGGARTGSKQHKPKGKEEETNKSMPLTAGKEVKALQVSTTGWKPRSIGQAAGAAGPAPGGEGYLAPDVVQRKVKAALNKMTPENFDKISGQILDIVSQSKDESDGRTLRQVIQLTFEKATDEAHWAPMYAKFAKRMLESMSPEIKDENIRDKMGNVVTGGSLFRKYLLNRCQEEFERGWKINLPPKPEGETEEVAMLSDEYYAAAAAKRRGLGLVKFIGELYKLGMLTERIMHECVKKLVDYEGIPDEAEVESLTSLLRTIGGSLDASEKGHAMMDAYFSRISMMIDTPGLPSRLRFMLMDIVDLRSARWRSKDADKGPKTIHEIREEAARQQQEAEMERLRQQANRGGRLPMGRGDARSFSGGYPNAPPPQDFASSKVGTDDLRRLRTSRNTTQPMSFGPSSMLGSRSSSGRKNLGPGGNLVRGSDDSAASSRNGASTPKKDDKEPASSANAFSALASLEDRDSMATSPPSNPTSPELTKSQPAVERRPSQAPSTTAAIAGGGGGGEETA